jgi:hypothetical protein
MHRPEGKPVALKNQRFGHIVENPAAIELTRPLRYTGTRLISMGETGVEATSAPVPRHLRARR